MKLIVALVVLGLIVDISFGQTCSCNFGTGGGGGGGNNNDGGCVDQAYGCECMTALCRNTGYRTLMARNCCRTCYIYTYGQTGSGTFG
uniref:ShKT domain-containing protein n=1 Tax=Panagrellus redivivus TaxID=6233 RepID=A0A7E4V724_PANRE